MNITVALMYGLISLLKGISLYRYQYNNATKNCAMLLLAVYLLRPT